MERMVYAKKLQIFLKWIEKKGKTEELACFAEFVCEMQKERCTELVADCIDDHLTEPFKNGIYIDADEMLSADEPLWIEIVAKINGEEPNYESY